MSDRFWSKVNKHGPRAGRLGRCWVWTAACDRKGYGRFWFNGKQVAAARYTWGDVPEGMLVLHHCDNPPCVRRSHLFLGTPADNSRDMVTKGRAGTNGNEHKTHCPCGHPYDVINTIRYRNGSRGCRICVNVRTAAWKRRQRAAA